MRVGKRERADLANRKLVERERRKHNARVGENVPTCYRDQFGVIEVRGKMRCSPAEKYTVGKPKKDWAWPAKTNARIRLQNRM